MSAIQATAPNILVVGANPTGGANKMQQGILASGQVASAATDTTIYQPAAKTSGNIGTATFHNAGTVAVAFTVAVVPAGQSVDATRRVTNVGASGTPKIQPGETLRLDELLGLTPGPGDFVSVNCDTAASLNYTLSGTETTAP